jgi:hypothetical protein
MTGLDLASVLQAEDQAPVSVLLPASAATVSIRTLLRREERAATDVPRSGSCWAPNKPSFAFEGTTTWPEFVLVRLLEHAGWDARWIRNWTGGRQFCVDVDQQRNFPPAPAAVFEALHRRAAHLRGAGTWDVFAWSGDDYLFLESKQHRSSDRLNANQIVFLEAALDEGFTVDQFAIVEYDAGPPIGASTGRSPRAVSPTRAVRATSAPPELVELLAVVRTTDRSERIESRNAVVAFGAVAVRPMTEWLKEAELRRFAMSVLEAIGRTDRTAVTTLRAYSASGDPDSHLASDAIDRLRGQATARRGTSR